MSVPESEGGRELLEESNVVLEEGAQIADLPFQHSVYLLLDPL